MNQDDNQWNQNNNYNFNTAEEQTVKHNKNNKKLIFLIVLIVVVIACVVIYLNKKNKMNDNTTDFENNESTGITSDWTTYDKVKHYEFAKITPLNLKDINVNLGKITFKSYNGSTGTLDFSNSSFKPSILTSNGFTGFIYMSLYDSFDEDSVTSQIKSDASIFNDVLKDGMEIVFYTADSAQAYTNCYINAYGSYWNLGVNIEDRTIEESIPIMKQLIQLIAKDDTDAQTVEEFTRANVKQMKFNLSRISLDNLEISGTGLVYSTQNNITTISKFGSEFYQDYIYVSDGTIELNMAQDEHYGITDTTELKELTINGLNVRLYRNSYNRYGKIEYTYDVGILEDNKEYVLSLYGKDQFSEEKAISFLEKFISKK